MVLRLVQKFVYFETCITTYINTYTSAVLITIMRVCFKICKISIEYITFSVVNHDNIQMIILCITTLILNKNHKNLYLNEGENSSMDNRNEFFFFSELISTLWTLNNNRNLFQQMRESRIENFLLVFKFCNLLKNVLCWNWQIYNKNIFTNLYRGIRILDDCTRWYSKCMCVK